MLSHKGLRFIADWEGFKNNVYKDAAGLPTIGVGHLLTTTELATGKIDIPGYGSILYENGLSDDQVMALLVKDTIRIGTEVQRLVKQRVFQHQYDALVSFAFNVGTGNFSSSTLLKRVNAGRSGDVPHEFMRWTKVRQDGNLVHSHGLQRRRIAEVKVFAISEYTKP